MCCSGVSREDTSHGWVVLSRQGMCPHVPNTDRSKLAEYIYSK